MRNNLENLELKLLQTRKENAEKLNKIEAEFHKKFSDFLDIIFKNDNLWFKRFINVYFQLEKLNNPEKSDLYILKKSFKKSLEIIPLNTKWKSILETKFFILYDKNILFENIFLKNSILRRDYNYPILEVLKKHNILDNNDLIKISLKFKETNSFLDSITILTEEKKEIVKKHYYELNDNKIEERQQNFKNDFKQEIWNSQILKLYPKILKFIWKNYFKLKLKNKVESKKDRLKRLYKIIFLKLYRLKYSWIDIDKIIQKINSIDDFEEFLNLLIKYFEVLKQNPKLQKDYLVSEEIDDINQIKNQAEENKDKIFFLEKNTIKVNEVFEDTENKLTQNNLDYLLSDNIDLIWNEFINREVNIWIYDDINSIDDEEDDDKNNEEEVDLEKYYEKLKWEYEEIEKKKSKLFLNWEYDLLDNLNEELLKLLLKIQKVEKLLDIWD